MSAAVSHDELTPDPRQKDGAPLNLLLCAFVISHLRFSFLSSHPCVCFSALPLVELPGFRKGSL